MGKFESISIFLILMLMIFTTLSTGLIYKKFLDEGINIEFSMLQESEQQTEPDGELKDFFVVARRFAQTHKYINGSYTCINYTNSLYDISQELGFNNIKKVKGCSEDGKSCHMWLKIEMDYEPQSYEFKDYSKEYPNQEIVSECNDKICISGE